MALTTKFINANISISQSLNYNSTISVSLSVSALGSWNTAINSSSTLQSSFSSILYTVPAGRTAKVYLPQIITVSFSRSGNISQSIIYLQGAGTGQNQGIASYNFVQGATLSFFYNSNFGRSISPAPFTIHNSADVTSVYRIDSKSMPYGPFSAQFQLNSIFQRTFYNSDSGLSAAYGYRFLGPGGSITVSGLASAAAVMTAIASVRSATLDFSYSFSASYVGTTNYYLSFMVIEESGS